MRVKIQIEKPDGSLLSETVEDIGDGSPFYKLSEVEDFVSAIGKKMLPSIERDLVLESQKNVDESVEEHEGKKNQET